MATTTQDAVKTVSPVGRLVWGSHTERQTSDYNGNQYDPGKGPFTFGVAIRKDNPDVAALLTGIYTQAVAGYPNNQNVIGRINNEWQTAFANGLFKFKIKDGDRPNDEGTLNPNTAGCWVFGFQTQQAPKATHWNVIPGVPNNGEIDPKLIERGYYVDVSMSYRVNGLTDGNAGIYLNPNAVRLIAYGEKIEGGLSTEQAFAGAAAPSVAGLPGASLSPLAPAGGLPAAAAAPVALPTAAAVAAPVAAVAGMPGLPTASPASVAVSPHTAFLPGIPGQ